MAVPMKTGGMKPSRVIYYVVLSGVTTGIGALFGALVGGISQEIIALCLAFAAGAMIYIVSGELTPEYSKLYQGRMSAIGNILGFIIGGLGMTTLMCCLQINRINELERQIVLKDEIEEEPEVVKCEVVE